MLNLKKFEIFIAIIVLLTTLTSCGIYKKVDSSVPIQGEERARKNVEEGRGISLSKIGRNNTTYQFSSSNPLWRASLEILDFMPLSTVDYSGGIIITDWYSNDSNHNESIKITIRFLNNEINAANVKIIVHQRICKDKNENCTIGEIKTKIKDELLKNILSKASLIEKEQKIKK